MSSIITSENNIEIKPEMSTNIGNEKNPLPLAKLVFNRTSS